MRRIRIRYWALAVALVGTAFAFACMNRELVDIPPKIQAGVSIEIAQSNADKIDLLLMVDNSNSMREEQSNLTSNLPTIIGSLTNPSPLPDGTIPASVESLQVGVVSSDMGSAGYPITTCGTQSGDDGILQHLPSPDVTGCAAT